MTAIAFALLVGQATAQDLEAILAKADALLEEAKTAYDQGRANRSFQAFVDAGFKLEEARIKYLVLQEIGQGELQKEAAGRLRAVQQLGKLINDGKAAVQKVAAPAEAPPPEPGVPAPSAAPPARPETDAIRRHPVPDTTAQKRADQLLKDLFKEDFAKKGGAESRALARRLLEEAVDSGDDPASLYALYRAAIDAAVQGSDVRTAVFACDELCRIFDVDGIALRTSTLSAAAKTARTPDDLAALVEVGLRLTEDCVAADLYTEADKAATMALQLAKKANHAPLVLRASTRAKEVSEAKSKFQSLKGQLETLVKSPDHPGANLEMGQFLCYVKGNWDLGLRFLAKGPDGTLKELATKEIAFPAEASELAALADAWEELSAKEKSPLRRGQMAAHARELFRAALPGATGLLRSKIEKKLENEGAATLAPSVKGAAVDLLALIDPKKDGEAGTWRLEGKALVGGGKGDRARLLIPYHPPDEYDLIVNAERVSGVATLGFGLSRGSAQWAVLFDTLAAGHQTGLDMVNGKAAWENETSVKGQLVLPGKPLTYEFRVRRDGIQVLLDGKSIIDWKGDYSSLAVNTRWAVADKKALFLCAYGAELRYSRISLLSVSGQGRRLR